MGTPPLLPLTHSIFLFDFHISFGLSELVWICSLHPLFEEGTVFPTRQGNRVLHDDGHVFEADGCRIIYLGVLSYLPSQSSFISAT